MPLGFSCGLRNCTFACAATPFAFNFELLRAKQGAPKSRKSIGDCLSDRRRGKTKRRRRLLLLTARFLRHDPLSSRCGRVDGKFFELAPLFQQRREPSRPGTAASPGLAAGSAVFRWYFTPLPGRAATQPGSRLTETTAVAFNA